MEKACRRLERLQGKALFAGLGRERMFVFVCVCFEGDVSRKTGFSLLSLEIKDNLLSCIYYCE